MDITVAICTWNRSDLLRMTLDRMCELEIPGGLRWELLVVDNNCTDDTAEVIESYKGRLPVKRVLETRMGHSNARNAAVRVAVGQYLLWTDDDVLVDQHWLAAMWNAFRQFPDAAVFGGVIEPLFSGTPPAWLRDHWRLVADAYAVRDFGDQLIPLGPDRLPFGANFALRAIEQRSHEFDPNLGRKGTGMRGGDETTVLRAIFAEGATGWWIPSAKVQHYIPPERQTLEYLRSFHEGVGETIGLRAAQRGPVSIPVLLYTRLRMWFASALLAVTRRLCSPPRWLEDLHIAAQYKGRLRGFATMIGPEDHPDDR